MGEHKTTASIEGEHKASPLQVTIILPIRSEARYIERCLNAVLAQDYPRECLQVLVVDGMSDDGTREIVKKIFLAHSSLQSLVSNSQSLVSNSQSPFSNLQLLDNPQRIVPTALNCGIQNARGEIIIRVDGHCVIARDYVRRCADALSTTDADCVGGAIETVGETDMARAIALAQSSPFGVGGARFRYSDRAEYVDTLAFGAYRREVFDRIGLFDEELVRNQDDEFNFRLTRAGGKIWLDPQIKSVYYSRASLRGLWKQYFEYGFWKVRVIQKHGRPASLRHLVPAAFVLALLLGAVLSMVTLSGWWFAIVLVPYLAANITASAILARRKGWRYFPLLPFAFAAMHLAYGVGFLGGILHFGIFSRPQKASSTQWTN